MKKNILKNNLGFTLVETLVAIGILSLSIAAAFTAVQSSLQNSGNVKDQITAFYLAQEGMEFIKNIRDENALHSLNGTPTDWLASLSAVSGDACYFGSTCIIDSPLGKTATARCSGSFGTCPNLNQDSNTGLFGYTSGWTATNFKREIQFQSLSAKEVLVTIKMTWINHGATKSFQVTGLLLNRE